MPLWSALPQASRWVQMPMHDSCLAMWRCCLLLGCGVGGCNVAATRVCKCWCAHALSHAARAALCAGEGLTWQQRGTAGKASACRLLCTLAQPLLVGYFIAVACTQVDNPLYILPLYPSRLPSMHPAPVPK